MMNNTTLPSVADNIIDLLSTAWVAQKDLRAMLDSRSSAKISTHRFNKAVGDLIAGDKVERMSNKGRVFYRKASNVG